MDYAAEKFRPEFQDKTESELVNLKAEYGGGSPRGRIITQIQKERRELPYKIARKAAVASIVSALAAVVSALAAWTSIWFQSAQTRGALNQSRQSPAPIAPAPSASPTPSLPP